MALIISTEMVEEIRYKIRTFGVNLEGPAEVYCDNKLVVTNSNVPAPVLNKINNTLFYHRVRESQADGTLMVVFVNKSAGLYSSVIHPTIKVPSAWDSITLW